MKKLPLILTLVTSLGLPLSAAVAADKAPAAAEQSLGKTLEGFFQDTKKQVDEAMNAKPGLVRGLAMEPEARAFLAAVVKSELMYVLQDEKPHTLLVPTNEAFMALPQEIKDRLINDKAFAKKVVAHHIFGGNLDGRGLWRARNLTSAAGQKVSISYWKKSLYANKVKLSKPNQKVVNGTFHLIDQVLIPKL